MGREAIWQPGALASEKPSLILVAYKQTGGSVTDAFVDGPESSASDTAIVIGLDYE